MLKYIIVGLVLICSCFGKTPRQNALIVAEYSEKRNYYENYINLVRYHFEDGKLTSKDTILGASSSALGYGYENNLVYKNKYIITSLGKIIDVQTKSILKAEQSYLYETRGDSLIFYKNFYPGYDMYYIYDLNENTYLMVDDYNFLNVRGVHSPNHKLGLEFRSQFVFSQIILYDRTNQPDTIVKDTCKTGSLTRRFNKRLTEESIYWVDNDNFLYISYDAQDDNPEYKNRTIFNEINNLLNGDTTSINITSPRFGRSIATAIIKNVNLKSRKSEIVVKIDSIPLKEANISFYADPAGKILFNCSKGIVEVDVENKNVKYLKFKNSGYGFSMEEEMNPEYGRIITYQNKEIGRLWCNDQAKTTDGFYSVAYGDLGSNLGYPKGVMVWNNITEKWTEIEIPLISGIIGWIEE